MNESMLLEAARDPRDRAALHHGLRHLRAWVRLPKMDPLQLLLRVDRGLPLVHRWHEVCARLLTLIRNRLPVAVERRLSLKWTSTCYICQWRRLCLCLKGGYEP